MNGDGYKGEMRGCIEKYKGGIVQRSIRIPWN